MMQRRDVIMILAGLTLSVMASSAPAQETPAQDFLDNAFSLSIFQVRAGQLAQERASDAATKLLAEQIHAFHGETLEKLTAAAQQDGLRAQGALNQDDEEKLQALSDATDSDFGPIFYSTLITAYAELSDLFQSYIQDGPPGAVRSVAETAFPQLHMLQVRAKSLSSPELSSGAATTDETHETPALPGEDE